LPEPRPPQSYEDLIRRIHDRYDETSKSFQKIALFLTQNPNDVAMFSVNALADKCGIHASNFVRYAQTLGFKGFKDLQKVFQRRLSTAAPGFDARIKALETELDSAQGDGAMGFLQNIVVRDIASLQGLLTEETAEKIKTTVDHLKAAETVFLVGQLRSSPVVDFFRYLLTMLGKRTVLLDASGGLATKMAEMAGPSDMLLAVSFRFYANEVVNVVENAASRGVPIVALSDSTLSPLAKGADVLFAIPEQEYAFSRSLAAPMSLAMAIAVALAADLQQDSQSPKIPVLTEEIKDTGTRT
jgi:DNA-binding MurR/RpiR family transcriptional regulator